MNLEKFECWKCEFNKVVFDNVNMDGAYLQNSEFLETKIVNSSLNDSFSSNLTVYKSIIYKSYFRSNDFSSSFWYQNRITESFFDRNNLYNVIFLENILNNTENVERLK